MILDSRVSLGDAEIRINADKVLECCKLLQLDADLQFDLLVNVTAVDYMDTEFMNRPDERFEVVYHLLSLKTKNRLRIKVAVGEKDPKVDSVTSVWAGANFMESEVWDMFGISFTGHPGLTRILMYEEFKGFPLRKDYPVQGKQPRIPLRKPEVENTARQMLRPSLVKINKRSEEADKRVG
jgi:NADH-quinone oxidoreductase subunit C